MTYHEATDFLFNSLPVFQSQGPGAYKPGLHTVTSLSDAFGSPHKQLRTIHIGGTNGKGSTAHTIAAVLQSAGMKVGLFTSPHLVDFRERIRINGEMIEEEAVVDFVERFRADSALTALQPSFFELTTVVAFEYFARENVDVAVIEVGLGGRLDSTNIITPDLCVITNISLDHTALLGHSLSEIAAEKAGIIKPGVPVVLSETLPETLPVFQHRAEAVNAPLVTAPQLAERPCRNTVDHPRYGTVTLQLTGACQTLNAAGILAAVEQLERRGYPITPQTVQNGFARVCQLTGLMGRWMQISEHPRTICDTGHNIGGWQLLSAQLNEIATQAEASSTGVEDSPRLSGSQPGLLGGEPELSDGQLGPGGGQPELHLILGFVNDKDISQILQLISDIPARIYWTQPNVPRARPASDLAQLYAAITAKNNVIGIYETVPQAYAAAQAVASPTDTIFIGGSTFIVADLLQHLFKDME